MRESAWLPDIDGNYKKPSELYEDSIDKAFQIVKTSPFFDAIEFGKEEDQRRKQLEEEELRRTAEYQSKAHAAKVLGLNDIDAFEVLRRKAELYDRAKAEGRIVAEKTVEEPTANTNNPNKRADKTIETTRNAPDKTYQYVVQSSRTSREKAGAVTMLKTLYTNDDDQMICQCCGHELPFRKKNREYYFETVELDRAGRWFSKETEYPYIACCPNCAAMFNEYIINSNSIENGLASLISKIKTGATRKKSNGNESIAIIMDGKTFDLTFVQKHIIDIRSVLLTEKI